jgi:hypothetical protein
VPAAVVPRLATMVPITPTATVVTKSARTTPLTARKPALGSSASRRAAISVATRLVRLAMSRDPTMVSQGPATTSPTMVTRMPLRYARTWPSVVSGRRPTK